MELYLVQALVVVNFQISCCHTRVENQLQRWAMQLSLGSIQLSNDEYVT
jgi:hypothetical protein